MLSSLSDVVPVDRGMRSGAGKVFDLIIWRRVGAITRGTEVSGV